MEALAGQLANTDQSSAFQHVLELHRETLLGQLDHLEELAGNGSYRTLSRALGAVLSEQQMVHVRYEEISEALVHGSPQSFRTSYYTVYPAAWVGWWHTDASVSIHDALRMRS